MDPLFLAYLTCAIIGGLVALTQFLLTYMGFSEQPGLGHNPFKPANLLQTILLLLYPVTIGLTAFGLMGMGGHARQWQNHITLAVALAAGLGAVVVFFSIAHMFKHGENVVQATGHKVIIGQSGVVTQAIPGQRSSVGRVVVKQRERTVEFMAVTPHGELAVGTRVIVAIVLQSDLLEVIPEAFGA
jgi:uncharacterized membrane protein